MYRNTLSRSSLLLDAFSLFSTNQTNGRRNFCCLRFSYACVHWICASQNWPAQLYREEYLERASATSVQIEMAEKPVDPAPESSQAGDGAFNSVGPQDLQVQLVTDSIYVLVIQLVPLTCFPCHHASFGSCSSCMQYSKFLTQICANMNVSILKIVQIHVIEQQAEGMESIVLFDSLTCFSF